MRGQILAVMLLLMINLWALGLLWPIFYDIVVNTFVPAMTSAGVNADFIANYQATFKALPYIFMIGLIIWAYLSTHRRDAEVTYVG